MKMKLFNTQEINTERQLAIDLAKVLAIVFMVFSHPFEYTNATPLDETVGLPFFIMFIGSHQFAAPIFMVCMGLGIAYSRRNDPRTVISRGISIFWLGIMLNVVRSFGSLMAFLFTENNEMLELFLEDLLIDDIFQLAGLSMMLLGLLRLCRLPYWGILLLSVAMSVVGSQFHMFSTGNCLVDTFLGLFIGTSSTYTDSYFPLLNWFIFVVAGYGIGRLIRRCENLTLLFAIVTPIAAAVYLNCAIYAIPRMDGMFDTSSPLHFYHIRTPDMLISLCAVLMTFGVSYFVMMVCPGWLKKFISRTAADLMRIYIAHWILITWVMSGLMQEILGIQFTVATTILTGFCLLVVSILLARVKPLSEIKI